MWEYQTTPLSNQGLRCIAFDRRGCGRSDRPGDGYDYDTLADDLADLLDHLDARDITLVGHSMGCGEITRYLSRHGTDRVARAMLIAPTTPFLLQTGDNPHGVPQEAYETMAAALGENRPAWLAVAAPSFFGSNMPGSTVGPELVEWGSALFMRSSAKATIELVAAMCADQRAEMSAYTMPTAIVHGDADQISPFEITGKRTAALIPHATVSIYEGAGHGLFVTHKDRLNAELLDFVRS
jgi:non-heme chloroperoxidase